MHTLFSVKVPCPTTGQVAWLMDRLVQMQREEEIACCLFAQQGDSVWLYTDEEQIGDPGEVANIICEFQSRFGITTPWLMSWATVCSRPRLDGFSGGAAVCHNGEASFIEARTWAQDEVERLDVLCEPLSREQMISLMTEDHYVTAVVHVDLSEVIDRNLADFVALLSERLTGDAMLADLNYSVVGQSGGTLHIEVSGDVSFYLDDD